MAVGKISVVICGLVADVTKCNIALGSYFVQYVYVLAFVSLL